MKISLKLKTYQAIIERLKTFNFASRADLIAAVNKKDYYNGDYTDRTFERDLHELIYEFHYPIKFDKKKNGYMLNFTEIDCDKNESLASKYEIETYPTIKLIKDDKVYDYDAKPSVENLNKFLNMCFE